MTKKPVETNNKQVQTIIHCHPFILTSNNDLVTVNCNRSCQTAASVRIDQPNSDLYPLLEFTPYQLIIEGAIKEIDLPRKSILHWKSEQSLITAPNSLPEQTQHKIHKSSLKSNYYKISSMSLPEDSKLSANSDVQTDISVSPHVLNIDEVANVVNDAAMQTTISCIPTASVSTILPQLKANLTHDFSNILHKDSHTSTTIDDISLKWPSSGVESVFELRLAKVNAQSGSMETDEDTDEFEEAVEYLKEPIEISVIDNSAIKHSSNEYEDTVEYLKQPTESQVIDEVTAKNIKNQYVKTVEFVENPANSQVTDKYIIKKAISQNIDTVEHIMKPTELTVKDEQRIENTTDEYEETVKYLKELIEPKATNEYIVKNSENEYDETVEHIQKIIESLVLDENTIKYPAKPYQQMQKKVENVFSGSKASMFPLAIDVKEITMPVDVSETSSSFHGSRDFHPESSNPNEPLEPQEPSYLSDEEADQQEGEKGEEERDEGPTEEQGEGKDEDNGDGEDKTDGDRKDEVEERDEDDSDESEKDPVETEEIDNATGFRKNTPNCSCGSNALKKIANQFRNQTLSIKLAAEEGPAFEERIIDALNTTMSVIQSEMAKLMDAFSDNKDISSTSCTCIDAPLTANDQVKITVDETRNTLQIKINKYTEVDDLHLSLNPPGDHVGHNSNNVECECHPSHSGAAPPYLFAPRTEAYSESRRIKPRGPTVSAYKAQQPCCSKISSHHSKIPTPLNNNRANSPRGKRSGTRVNTICDTSNKTYCTDKSTGVQTDIALGDKLQSESLNSLEEHGGMSWNHISLPPPGTYNIKSICKTCPSTKQTSVKIQEPRSSRNHAEIPWNDILLPQGNTFDNSTFSQVSCACRSNSNVQGKLSKPSISIKMRSSKIAQSKSYTDSSSASKIPALPTTSDPGIQTENKANISIKIVDKENTEINREIVLKPGNNTITVNLDDVRRKALQEKTKTESGPQEEDAQPEPNETQETSETQEGSDLKEGSEPSKESKEESESNDQDNNTEELQNKASTSFAPAQCTCKDNMKPTIFKPDPVMVAMETCEAEMKPLRQALEELQMKVRNLNLPELKGCMCTVALEEYSKCKSTLGTGRPDPADIPHIDEPTNYNTYGPCASFKPAKLYVPQPDYPFGRLPPPVLTVRTPMEINAPASILPCSCKKRKHGKSKRDKEINTQKNIKCKPCDANTNTVGTKSSKDKKPNYYTYFSTTETNSPFMYKQSESETSKKLYVKLSPPVESSKETSYYDTDFNDDDNDDNISKHQKDAKENHKHRKKKHLALPRFKEFDFDTSIPYHSVYDVQNLQPWQAVKTDPDDFLLPFKESTYINGFRSPHSLWPSMLTQTASK